MKQQNDTDVKRKCTAKDSATYNDVNINSTGITWLSFDLSIEYIRSHCLMGTVVASQSKGRGFEFAVGKFCHFVILAAIHVILQKCRHVLFLFTNPHQKTEN